MDAVKNSVGLAVVVFGFLLGFTLSAIFFVFGAASLVNGYLPFILSIALVLVGGAGLVLTSWVLALFAVNFSWRELMNSEKSTKRDKAPVSVEVKMDDQKQSRYLVDSRNSPRSTNPEGGRGLFIMKKRRGKFVDDDSVITLSDTHGSKIDDVLCLNEKITYKDEKGKKHTLKINSITEYANRFDKKDAPIALSNKSNTKQYLAEQWCKALKEMPTHSEKKAK